MNTRAASSEKTSEIVTALIAARLAIPEIPKDKENTFVRDSRGQPVTYASLQSTISTAAPHLLVNNIYPQEGTRYNEETHEIEVFLRLHHVSGQWIESSVSVYPRPDKTNFIGSMAIGAPITYARRYCWRLALGLADTEADDDGAHEVSTPQNNQVSSPIVKPAGYHQNRPPENPMAPPPSAYQAQANATAPRQQELPAIPLTDEQKTQLDLALTSTNPDMEKFLKYLGLTKLSQVDSRTFDKAIRALEVKKARQNGGGKK